MGRRARTETPPRRAGAAGRDRSRFRQQRHRLSGHQRLDPRSERRRHSPRLHRLEPAERRRHPAHLHGRRDAVTAPAGRQSRPHRSGEWPADHRQSDDVPGGTPDRRAGAGGAKTNPHDLVTVADHKAYVTRYQPNAAATSPAQMGNDIAVIDPTTGAFVSRIDVDAYASTVAGATILARPDRALIAGGKIVVSLNEIDASYKTYGDGMVIVHRSGHRHRRRQRRAHRAARLRRDGLRPVDRDVARRLWRSLHGGGSGHAVRNRRGRSERLSALGHEDDHGHGVRQSAGQLLLGPGGAAGGGRDARLRRDQRSEPGRARRAVRVRLPPRDDDPGRDLGSRLRSARLPPRRRCCSSPSSWAARRRSSSSTSRARRRRPPRSRPTPSTTSRRCRSLGIERPSTDAADRGRRLALGACVGAPLLAAAVLAGRRVRASLVGVGALGRRSGRRAERRWLSAGLARAGRRDLDAAPPAAPDRLHLPRRRRDPGGAGLSRAPGRGLDLRRRSGDLQRGGLLSPRAAARARRGGGDPGARAGSDLRGRLLRRGRHAAGGRRGAADPALVAVRDLRRRPRQRPNHRRGGRRRRPGEGGRGRRRGEAGGAGGAPRRRGAASASSTSISPTSPPAATR